MNINQTRTSCGACPYCNQIGECTWDKKCSYQLAYTYNNQDDIIDISPMPYLDPENFYLNKTIIRRREKF